MSKEECVSNLIRAGFVSALESGVVMIYVQTEKDIKKVNKAIKSIGYNASYGIRIKEARNDT